MGGWLVGKLVTLSDFQSLVSNGRSNQKISKNKVHIFSNFASGRTSQLVPNPFNWSPAHSTGPQKLFFTEISVSVAQIKKIKKTKFIYFRILILGGPVNRSPTHSTGLQPIQLVPKNCLLQKSQNRSLKSKNLKNLVYLFLNFDSGRISQLAPNPFNWSPTHS